MFFLSLGSLGTLKTFAFSGADPRFTWKAASVAANLALKKAAPAAWQIDIIGIHEAFSAQTLAKEGIRNDREGS